MIKNSLVNDTRMKHESQTPQNVQSSHDSNLNQLSFAQVPEAEADWWMKFNSKATKKKKRESS